MSWKGTTHVSQCRYFHKHCVRSGFRLLFIILTAANSATNEPSFCALHRPWPPLGRNGMVAKKTIQTTVKHENENQFRLTGTARSSLIRALSTACRTPGEMKAAFPLDFNYVITRCTWEIATFFLLLLFATSFILSRFCLHTFASPSRGTGKRHVVW